MSLASAILPVRDFWVWFADETRALSRPMPFYSPGEPDVQIHLGKTGSLFPAEIHTKGSREPVLIDSADELRTALQQSDLMRSLWCRLCIANGRFIVRPIAPLRLPRSRALAMARSDVAANTPFSLEGVHVLLSAHGARADTTYCLIKRAELDPVVEAIHQSRGTIRELDFETTDHSYSCDRIGLKALNPNRLIDRLKLGLTTAMVLVAIAGTTGLFMLASERLNSAERALDTQIAETRKRANEARSAFEAHQRQAQQMSSLKDEKTLAASTVYAWEHLSRALPDDTWLSDLTLEEGSISLTGLSTSAAKLIPLLEEDPVFEAPEFESAVMRVPGQDVERFSLRMRLKSEEPEG